MAVRQASGDVCMLVFEWKFTENYRHGVPVGISARGTSRIEIYKPLLDRPDCPILHGEHERLFYEPIYQLVRQTLLAWRMVEAGELGATTWLHVLVVPAGNTPLRTTPGSPVLESLSSLEAAFRSVLRRPERFRVVDPGMLMPSDGGETPWRKWLRRRYGS